MKEKNYYLNMTEQERIDVIHALIAKKNALAAQGRYTDLVDDVICKISKARKKTFIIT